MNGAIIAQLLIKFGPIAFSLVEDLVKVWSKDMTPEEVRVFVATHRKSYDDYIAAEKASRMPTTIA